MKPLLLGLVSARVASSPAAVENGRRLLASFADREGFELAEIYVDGRQGAPVSAWAALLGAIRRGSARAVEFRLRMDFLEVWRDDACLAVFDRDVLHDWLADPDGELGQDDVTFTIDHATGTGDRLMIRLPNVRRWALSPGERHALLAAV
jgi:hypothetical protein